MPTHEEDKGFWTDFGRLTPEKRASFADAIEKFVHDLRGGTFRAGLRVKRVRGWPGVWEMTWAPDGRATFSYGRSVRDGDPHLVWRRVGTHDIFDNP